MKTLTEPPALQPVSLDRSELLPVSRKSTEATDWFLLLIPGLIWGASFLFIAQGLEAVGPNGLTFARILVGFATLALFPSARGHMPRSAWPSIALLGVLWMAFPLSRFRLRNNASRPRSPAC